MSFRSIPFSDVASLWNRPCVEPSPQPSPAGTGTSHPLPLGGGGGEGLILPEILGADSSALFCSRARWARHFPVVLKAFAPSGRGYSRLAFVAALLVWTSGVWAEQASPNPDDLLYRATRYGNTAERRTDKEAARNELFAMGAAGLRAVMARAHIENLMLHVLAFELVNERVPAEQGTAVLAECLSSEHPQTRRIAAYLLGFYPRADAHVPALVALLDEEKQRNAALRTLGKWKVESVSMRARELLKAENERTRIAACNALASICRPDDLPALIVALGDRSLLVRNAAARVIFAKGRAAIRPLRHALDDATDERRRQVVRLLVALDALPSREHKRLAADPALQLDLEYPGPDTWF